MMMKQPLQGYSSLVTFNPASSQQTRTSLLPTVPPKFQHGTSTLHITTIISTLAGRLPADSRTLRPVEPYCDNGASTDGVLVSEDSVKVVCCYCPTLPAHLPDGSQSSRSIVLPYQTHPRFCCEARKRLSRPHSLQSALIPHPLPCQGFHLALAVQRIAPLP